MQKSFTKEEYIKAIEIGLTQILTANLAVFLEVILLRVFIRASAKK